MQEDNSDNKLIKLLAATKMAQAFKKCMTAHSFKEIKRRTKLMKVIAGMQRSQ